VDIQDIKKAAAEMLDSLIETGVLRRAKHQPAQLVIGKSMCEKGRFSRRIGDGTEFLSNRSD